MGAEWSRRTVGWDVRGKFRYFYLPRRINGKPRRIYCGTGALGEMHARLVAEEQRRRQAARSALRHEQAQVLEAETVLAELSQHAVLLAKAVIVSAGFYQHNGGGAWRRRREEQEFDQAGRG